MTLSLFVYVLSLGACDLSLSLGLIGPLVFVKYDDIARELDVEDTEIEGWVIRAIGAGLIEGKMNQLERTVRQICLVRAPLVSLSHSSAFG